MRSIFLAGFLVLAAISQVVAMTWNVVKLDGRRYVPIADVARFYGLKVTSGSAKSFKITGSGRRIEGSAGRREVLINGVKYILAFPLKSHKGTAYLSAMDVTKIIEPVLRPGRIASSSPLRTVVLDPGHGGHDSGAVGPLGREKAYALDVALRARALLIKAGYNVKLTRTTDVFIPLHERSGFANRYRDAVMVSIHFNKSKTTGGTGIETFALAPRGVPSMDEASLSYSDFKENPGNKRDSENIALAAAIHSAMVRQLPVPDRGIKRARFHVIRATSIPSVLLEGGFMNHPKDSRLIANPEYRQRMAMSIFQGIEAYKRALNPSGPAPSLIVSGAQPSSIPDLDAPEATSEPEPSPTPVPEIKPLPDNWHLGYPPGRKPAKVTDDAEGQDDGHNEGMADTDPDAQNATDEASVSSEPAPAAESKPLTANWNLGYPPGRNAHPN
jgi:N-acetylmuramoyl-L-alanine amidase